MRAVSEPIPPDSPVGVVGAGTMGAGIAQVAAAAGHPVRVLDAQPGAAEAGIARTADALAARVDRGRLAAADRDALLARIAPVTGAGALAGCALVIEAIVESLEPKRALLAELEGVVGEHAILASNTSSLSITALASGLAHPGRVLGMHFFNPAPVMRLVEVVTGLATDAPVAARAMATARAWGKVAVQARSTPGFIVNRVARPYYGEALRLLEEQAADAATLDALMTGCGGFPLGPFALMDLIGNDVNHAVTCSVFDAFHHDPRYRPSLLQKERVDAGWLGRKSGRGWYLHDGTPPPAPSFAPRAAGAAGAPPWRPGGGVPFPGATRVALTDGRTAAGREADDGAPVVLVDRALDAERAPCIAVTASPRVTADALHAVIASLQAAGLEVALLPDTPALVVTRTVAMLANEAFEAALHGVASLDGIDDAMRHGVGYPRGPVAWARALGLRDVLGVLDALARVTGDPRYRASLGLRRAAALEARR